jgi:hypothetical protein
MGLSLYLHTISKPLGLRTADHSCMQQVHSDITHGKHQQTRTAE